MSIDKNISNKTIGTKIGKYTKYQREKRGYSLNEFAKKIGINTSFLLRLEKGVYASVKFDIIEKLSNGFEMTVDEFLQKCKITSSSQSLPPIDFYLKEMYQFPKDAIDDAKLFIDLLKKKYKKEIQQLKGVHKEYWSKRNK